MMDVGCSLKGSTASTMAWWHPAYFITKDFSKLSQIRGNSCGENGECVSLHICDHQQQLEVLNRLVYL